jgi:HK97 family phage major capsid protein
MGDLIVGNLNSLERIADLERMHEQLRASVEWAAAKSLSDGVIHPDIVQDADGRLHANGPIGERKLRTLKSGAYTDTFVDYLRGAATRNGEWRSAVKDTAMKVLEEGQDPAGGFWVPPTTMRDALIKKSLAPQTVRPNAKVVLTGSNMTTLPSAVYTTDNNYTTGARAVWQAEAPNAAYSAATDPAAGQLNVPCHVLLCYVVASRSLFEDSQPDLLGIFADLLGDSMGGAEESAFWTGDGVGKPQGILSHPSVALAAASGGCYVASGDANKLTWGSTVSTSLDGTKGLLGVDASLAPQYEAATKWYFNKTTKSTIRAFTDGQGRPLWPESSTTLMGYPREAAQFMPDVAANAYPVALGDMGGYTVTDRTGISIQVLTEASEALALGDKVVILARKRVGGQLVQPWRLRFAKVAVS